MKLSCRPRTRAEALIIWRQIAEGILNEPRRLSNSEPPSPEYYECVEFLTHVAIQVVIADASNEPHKRPRELMKAIQLGGKRNHDEPAIRKTVELVEDFGFSNPKKEGKQLAVVVRSQIKLNSLLTGRTRTAAEKDDTEILRQVRELKNQDKKKD